jgi:hypothetical protein
MKGSALQVPNILTTYEEAQSVKALYQEETHMGPFLPHWTSYKNSARFFDPTNAVQALFSETSLEQNYRFCQEIF